MSRPRITILSLSPIHRDARVLRHIRRLAISNDVTVVGYGRLGPNMPASVSMRSVRDPAGFIRRNIRAVPQLVVGRAAPRLGYDRWFWSRPDYCDARDAVAASRPDLVLANDWDALPIAAVAAERCKARIVLDLHEYAPEHWGNRRMWMALIAPMIDHFLRRYYDRVSAFITVGQTIADRYEREYGFQATVVMNAPDMQGERKLRPTDASRIQLVHHGGATSERRLEGMIEALSLCDHRFFLHFMLIEMTRGYVDTLRRTAATMAPGRVTFAPPVAPHEIQDSIASHDIGIFILPPTTYNYHAALPNKFFDFVGAGLAVCVGPSPEMARLTRAHQLGVVTQDFDPRSVARALNALSPTEIDEYKANSIAARTLLTAGREGEKLVEAVQGALNAPPRGGR